MSNIDQLRHDIDSGRTGEKVPFPDPAAAPLGTDAEAGGHPPRPGEVAMDQAASRQGAVQHQRHDKGVPIYVPLAVFVILAVVIMIVIAG